MALKIKEGFRGQRMAVYSNDTIMEALHNPLTSGLVIHSMGLFPNAEDHCVTRNEGCNEHILVYCCKGKGYYVLNGQRHEVREQQFFTIPANRAHEIGSSKNNPWTVYWIHFKGEKASSVVSRLQGVHNINVCERSRIADRTSLFDEILNVMEYCNDENSVEYVNMCLNQLLASLLFVETYREAKNPSNKKKDSVFLSRTLHFMKENIQNKITISDMAQALNYSESYFYRLFFKETNQAPMTYFMNMKIDYACSLLQRSEMRIYQVAMKIGFDDCYYFSRFFKKHTGYSPSQYRETISA